ncbi:hypothetical protein RRG08_033578 [Elysia crispata]|uniref:Uncharacterized protein n=1 Tax=Elysia crispata TaxID=231223 RepID=A0AAE0XNS6_9GAST|nr:hypothetical protein RRG08_033578 [Elysia crispata]
MLLLDFQPYNSKEKDAYHSRIIVIVSLSFVQFVLAAMAVSRTQEACQVVHCPTASSLHGGPLTLSSVCRPRATGVTRIYGLASTYGSQISSQRNGYMFSEEWLGANPTVQSKPMVYNRSVVVLSPAISLAIRHHMMRMQLMDPPEPGSPSNMIRIRSVPQTR